MKSQCPRHHRAQLSPPSQTANALSRLHRSSRHRQRITTTITIIITTTITITMLRVPLSCRYPRLESLPPQSSARGCSTVSLTFRDAISDPRCIRRRSDVLRPGHLAGVSNPALSRRQSHYRASKGKRTAPSPFEYRGSTFPAWSGSKSVYGGRFGGQTCTRMIRTQSRRRCMRDGSVANGRTTWTCHFSTSGAVKNRRRRPRGARWSRSRPSSSAAFRRSQRHRLPAWTCTSPCSFSPPFSRTRRRWRMASDHERGGLRTTA